LFPVSRRGGNIPVETMSEPDDRLIAEFNARRSEEAFAALVRQHVNLVFATALRQVGDAGAAEEITQNVFVALAQAAGKLGSHPTIAGWLHQTALNKSREWLRSELRRRRREQVAVNLDLARAEGDSVWSPLVPLLDEALLELREPDRLAVILHFMEGRTFQEVGSALGIGEDTARKRVNRCLDQLTHFFRRRGFAAPALMAGAPLFTLSSHAAPAGLAASATTAGLAAAHSAATSTLTLIKGALKIMAWTKAKTAIVVGVGVLLAVGTTTTVIHHEQRRLPKPQPVISGETEFPKASWRFAGYADPESALQSLIWAFGNGDVRAFRNSVSPAIQRENAGKPDSAIITAQSKATFARVKGYRILDKQALSEDEVVFTCYAEGLNDTQKFSLKRIGNEWKFDSNPKK
jgi:RNA polymerase sigma factor (sigma-70 family)